MPSSENQSDQYSSWVGLIYVFNLIVGTGALTLPAVFADAGWLLSFILVMLLAFVSFITVTFIVESMACANATIHWRKIQLHKVDESEVTLDSDSEESNVDEQTVIINRIRATPKYYVLDQQVELGEMTSLYFSKLGRILFYISLCIYLYGDLAIYAAAVSKTLTDLTCKSVNNNTNDYDIACWESFDIFKLNVYRVYIVMFTIFVCPFTYFNVQKTKYLQVFTTSMRWCAFLIMIILASARLGRCGQQGHPPLVNIASVPALIGASVYSFMCHHSIPGLITPFVNKQFVLKQLGLDYVLICTFYLLLAVTGSFAFRHVYDLYTLNFVPNNFGESSNFMVVIQYYLGLFPVFTLSTSFPIIAITLQNNLKALVLDVNIIERYNFVLRHLTFPTLAAVPPIIVALCTHNLSSLVEFTGSYAGVIIQYVIPAVLVYCARQSCKRDIGTVRNNRFSSPFKHNFWIAFVISWSFICMVFVTVNLVTSK